MFKNNKSLFVIAIIAVVNALGYGIIIPVLYSYSQRFGMSDFENGLLFSIFSIFQFIATPVIGRLSDKYGRKPLLLLSVLGTAVSFLMMAFAPSKAFIFLARALDGITAGNIPVASAVISDTTEPKDRAKGFGIIGASFGFGFIFGPAISALTVGFSPSAPFLIASAVSFICVVLIWLMLKETNKHMGEISDAKLFDFKKLALSLFDENIGATLLLTFLSFLAFSLFIYAYQPFSVKILQMSATQISINFTVFGLVGLIAQMFVIPWITKRYGDQKSLVASFLALVFTFAGFYFTRSYAVFLFISVFQSLANAFTGPLLQAVLSREADAKSQGSIMGINASYQSIGMIVGPVLGGLIATYSIPMPFLGGAVVMLGCWLISLHVMRKPVRKEALV